MRAALRRRIIEVCDKKITRKGPDVGLSFYAFFANKNDDPTLLMEAAEWWIEMHQLDHFEKAVKIRKMVEGSMTEKIKRSLVTTGSYLEPEIGFSRAVRVGNIIAVSGTASIASQGGTQAVGDVFGQTHRCLEIIQEALQKAGGCLENVIRTRVMLTDISTWSDAALAHGKFFGSIRPATTFVEVSRFIDPLWLVELEVDCVVD